MGMFVLAVTKVGELGMSECVVVAFILQVRLVRIAAVQLQGNLWTDDGLTVLFRCHKGHYAFFKNHFLPLHYPHSLAWSSDEVPLVFLNRWSISRLTSDLFFQSGSAPPSLAKTAVVILLHLKDTTRGLLLQVS